MDLYGGSDDKNMTDHIVKNVTTRCVQSGIDHIAELLSMIFAASRKRGDGGIVAGVVVEELVHEQLTVMIIAEIDSNKDAAKTLGSVMREI